MRRCASTGAGTAGSWSAARAWWTRSSCSSSSQVGPGVSLEMDKKCVNLNIYVTLINSNLSETKEIWGQLVGINLNWAGPEI